MWDLYQLQKEEDNPATSKPVALPQRLLLLRIASNGASRKALMSGMGPSNFLLKLVGMRPDNILWEMSKTSSRCSCPSSGAIPPVRDCTDPISAGILPANLFLLIFKNIIFEHFPSCLRIIALKLFAARPSVWRSDSDETSKGISPESLLSFSASSINFKFPNSLGIPPTS
uniref:Uncharacterized protein n=1 Tax=Salix viminalis TaxID=40686 RepID=A0A6N2LNK3_SALVM